MYRIMIVKSKKNEEYLYQFLLATKKDLATGLDVLAPVELATVGELDAYVEKMLNEDGYAKYRDYAKKQADDVLKVKHDWSLFEHQCSVSGKVDGIYLIRKSFGAMKPLLDLVS